MNFSDDMADEILKIFQVEAEEIISKLNDSLSVLEKKPSNKDAILTLFRDAHTLKGASRMVGFNNVQSISHKMEDILGLAKENKILLNTKVVNILYKTVDFLSDLIQKSINQGHEVYNQNISEQISILSNIEQLTDKVSPNQDQLDVDMNELKENIKQINTLISESLFNLMRLESERNEKSIKEFLATTQLLYEIFEKTGPYEIKKMIEDINVKLSFTQSGSNSLTNSEIESLHKTLDGVIHKLVPVCELYNLEFVDYYSIAFDKMAQTPKEAPQKEINEAKWEVLEDESHMSIQENIDENQAVDINPDTGSEDLEHIQQRLFALSQNEASPEEVKILLTNYEKSCPNRDVKKILLQTIKILEFIEVNEVQINEDTVLVLQGSLEHCDDLIKNNLENTDNELIVQRLDIVKKVLELNLHSDKEEVNAIAKSGYKIKNKKISDFSKVFNTGAIKTLRVESSKLDSLINQVSELTITKIKIKKHLSELNLINKELADWQKSSIKALNYLKHFDKKYFSSENIDPQIPHFIKQLIGLYADNSRKIQETAYNVSNLYRTIQDDDTKMNSVVDGLETMVKEIRVLPLATVFHLFGRMVRDIAQEKGKKIDLEIIGSETSTDKKIIEEIKTPLIHIIRNSIDHGIESPEERLALGKNPTGKIVLSAKQVGNKVIIQIIDDGKGLNNEKIKEKAIQKGFLTQEEIDAMSEEQITNIIFSPGFSTGEEITNISGRGIGLDVVQSKIAQLNGKVKVLSEVNKGCCVQIELPTTMSTIKAFLVMAGEQTFAIPMDSINTVLRKNENDIIDNKGRKSIVFKEKTIPLCSLSNVLNMEENCSCKNKETVLILENDDKIMALCVDKLIGDQEILHKKLSAPLYKLKNISGITTLVSGEVCLILNVSDILNAGTNIQKPLISIGMPKQINKSDYLILLVDDSITTRTLEKNILTKVGYKVETAQNPMEAIEKMKQMRFDLIISDWEMPEMNGLEFLESLKGNEMFGDIPFVMLSSLMSLENKKRAIDLGAEKYLIKSEFNQEELIETVSNILSKRAN